MNRTLTFSAFAVLGVVLALASGCASQRLTVYPAVARPGMVVRVTVDRPVFRPGREARVRIGGSPAAEVRLVSASEVDVLVPVVATGAAEVTVGSGKRAGYVTVLPAPSVELILSLKGSTLSLVRATPRAGEVESPAPEEEPRLSIDVVNEKGGLVWSVSVVHPTRGSREVFDGPDVSHSVLHRIGPPQQAAVFALRIPNVPGRSTVRFYEVPPGVDLATESGRTVRTLLGEVVVEQKENP